MDNVVMYIYLPEIKYNVYHNILYNYSLILSPKGTMFLFKALWYSMKDMPNGQNN